MGRRLRSYRTRGRTCLSGGIAQLTRGMAGVVNGLSNVRNRVGSGHGRPEHANGLVESHVLLSIDSVYTLTRFVAQRHRELRRK